MKYRSKLRFARSNLSSPSRSVPTHSVPLRSSRIAFTPPSRGLPGSSPLNAYSEKVPLFGSSVLNPFPIGVPTHSVPALSPTMLFT